MENMKCENCKNDFLKRVTINYNINTDFCEGFKEKISDLTCEKYCRPCAELKIDIDMTKMNIIETNQTIDELKTNLKFHRKNLKEFNEYYSRLMWDYKLRTAFTADENEIIDNVATSLNETLEKEE